MKAHNLKVIEKFWIKYLDDKSWSIRKNDRDFQVGDVCFFNVIKTKESIEVDRIFGGGTSEILKIIKRITHHKDFPEGIQEGYCILELQTLVEKRVLTDKEG